MRLSDMDAALVACSYRSTQDRQAIDEHLMQWRARLQGRHRLHRLYPWTTAAEVQTEPYGVRTPMRFLNLNVILHSTRQALDL